MIGITVFHALSGASLSEDQSDVSLVPGMAPENTPTGHDVIHPRGSFGTDDALLHVPSKRHRSRLALPSYGPPSGAHEDHHCEYRRELTHRWLQVSP